MVEPADELRGELWILARLVESDRADEDFAPRVRLALRLGFARLEPSQQVAVLLLSLFQLLDSVVDGPARHGGIIPQFWK